MVRGFESLPAHQKGKVAPIVKFNSIKYLILLGVAFIATFLAYIWFSNSIYFPIANSFIQKNFIVFFLSLISVKIIGIIWPPLPGTLFSVAAVPIIGWFNAYLIDFLGTLLGSSIVYLLGKKYGLKFLAKIIDKESIKKIKSIKIKKNKEIESIFLLRVFGGVLIDFVAYGAGFFQINFAKFSIGFLLSHIVLMTPIFYLTDSILKGNNIIFGVLSILIITPIFLKLRHRYIIINKMPR